MGSLTSPADHNSEDAGDGAYGLSSLSEKTRISNHLQMSLQRKNILLSYFKTLSVGPFWGSNPRPPAVRRSTNWANRSAVVTASPLLLLTHSLTCSKKFTTTPLFMWHKHKFAFYIIEGHPNIKITWLNAQICILYDRGSSKYKNNLVKCRLLVIWS